MKNITEQPDPATNSRYTLLPNGAYTELVAVETQIFYDPVTMDVRAFFNGVPFINLGDYMQFGVERDHLEADFTNRMTERFFEGVNPLTGNDLSSITLLDFLAYTKCVYDTLHNERADARAQAIADAEAAAAAAQTAADTAANPPATP